MARFIVRGGMAGKSNPAADETARTEPFGFEFDSRGAALARAQEICLALQPGGEVSVWDESTIDPTDFFNEAGFVGLASRYLSGEWFVNTKGIDLRYGKTLTEAQLVAGEVAEVKIHHGNTPKDVALRLYGCDASDARKVLYNLHHAFGGTISQQAGFAALWLNV